MSFTPKSGGGGEGDEAVGTSVETDLANSFRNLDLLEGDDDGAKRMELISKLEASRTQAAEEERRARRAAWTEVVRKVILERQLFQESGTTNLFPELVWEPILKKLEDPKDKARLSNMSLLWRDLLKEDRTTFLFGYVFSLMNEQTMLSRADLLQFREVCRSWKKSMENWLQNKSDYYHHPMLEPIPLRNPPRPSMDLMPVMLWDGVIDRFLDFCVLAYEPETGNPFQSRRLVVENRGPNDLGSRRSLQFIATADLILTVWGMKLWTLEIGLGTFKTLEVAYNWVCALLRMMPNLRTLIIKSGTCWRESPHHVLQDCLNQNPLPELPHLKSLMTTQAPPQMTKLLVEKFGPTLDTFIGHGVDGNVYEQAQLPNLKQMSLQLSYFSQVKMNWPSIHDLDLKWETVHFVATEIPNLFLNLGGIGGTLRKLNLILLNGKDPQPRIKLEPAEIKMLFLELPCLEEFSLTMALGPGNLKTIDFILPMTKLRILNLIYMKVVKKPGDKQQQQANPKPETGPSKQQGVPSGGGAIIQFWEYTNRLYESNIWKLFPELRKVHITTFLIERSEPDPFTGLRVVTSKDFIKEMVYTREGRKRYFMKRNMTTP